MSSEFDFIIAGGGTSGCLLANRLANAPARPSVLLVEVGGEPVGETVRPPFYRFMNAFMRPDLDHGYSTTNQPLLNNRSIQYPRGKALGGSSVLNFMAYVYGSGEDYNRWGELVGDDSWRWENTKELFKRIENYDMIAASSYSQYANPSAAEHGQRGLVNVSLPLVLEKGTAVALDAMDKFGMGPRNLDLNSGDPVGVGIFPSSYGHDGRTTSATAHLLNAPNNLTIWSNATVSRFILDGKKVLGVELADGRQAMSKKDVIISAGALDSPKLLLLNGIGPADELAAHNINVVHDLPGVGKNLQDHLLVFMPMEVDPSLTDKHAFESDAAGIAQAQEQWLKDQTGPFTLHNSTLFGGFPKLPRLEDSAEFKALDKDLQGYLSKPTVPSYEIIGNAPLAPPGFQLAADSAFLTLVAFLMNPQSRGEVTLRSTDPHDAPAINPKYMEHAFDRKAMLETIREVVTFVRESDLKKYFKRFIFGPASTSDKDIQEFMKEGLSTGLHANGTVKMGKLEDSSACVSPDFRVYGMEGLRVVDMSVSPLTPNNHTQTTAYLIGQKAADAIIAEYDL